MINYDEIRTEIERLEHSQTTYANVEKLAMLYQVLNNAPDQPSKPVQIKPYSYASDSDSEFIKAVRNADFERVLKVLNDHMEAVRILYPKEYDAVLRRLNAE